jgi:hypothetical protein
MSSRLPIRIVQAAAVLAVAALSACESVPLLAPNESIITVTSSTRTLSPGGSTEVTAFVIEQAGTPVHNGTLVRFTASLGQVNPVEVETRGGVAVTTFTAGGAAGTATVRATSGSATGGDGASPSNVVEIQIGSAAANIVTVNASPSRLPVSGGTSTIVAAVLDAAGNRLLGVPVTFSTTAGTLSATSAATDSSGDARVSLTTNREAQVTARVSDKTSQVTVTVGDGAPISVNVTASSTTPQRCQPVTFTAAVAPTTETVSAYDWQIRSNLDAESEDVRTTGNQLTRSFRTTGTKLIIVIASTPDGRIGSGQTQINVQPETTVVCSPNP